MEVAIAVLAGCLLSASVSLAGVFLFSDRRRRLRAGRYPGPTWAGRCAATVPVDLAAPAQDAADWALKALQGQSRAEVVAVDPWTWVVWTGLSWRSWGQEISVAVTTTGPSSCRLYCSSRPRLATTFIDWGASQHAASELAARVKSCAPALARHPSDYRDRKGDWRSWAGQVPPPMSVGRSQGRVSRRGFQSGTIRSGAALDILARYRASDARAVPRCIPCDGRRQQLGV